MEVITSHTNADFDTFASMLAAQKLYPAPPRPGSPIHKSAHHPASDGDLKGSVEVIRPYGSSTAVLTHIIKKRKIELSAQEATVLMAGIYDDTGSLSYPSTTPKDMEAAAFLLSKGADLNAVTGFLKKG